MIEKVENEALFCVDTKTRGESFIVRHKFLIFNKFVSNFPVFILFLLIKSNILYQHNYSVITINSYVTLNSFQWYKIKV